MKNESVVEAAKAWVKSRPHLDESDEDLAVAAWLAALEHKTRMAPGEPVSNPPEGGSQAPAAEVLCGNKPGSLTGWCRTCYPPEAPGKTTSAPAPAPVPMVIHCPECKTRHIDVGEFATKPHHTHACQGCGLTWRPAIGPTVGVQFLPGFKNRTPTRIFRNEEGSRCSTCDGTHAHVHGYDEQGEVPGMYDGSDWLAPSTPPKGTAKAVDPLDVADVDWFVNEWALPDLVAAWARIREVIQPQGAA